MKIKDAQWMMSADHEQRDVGVVQLKVDACEAPLVALMEPGSLEVIKVYQQQADYELDWYENSQHLAYPEVTREYRDVLNTSAVREQLNKFPSVASHKSM